jgi:choline kinase
MTVPHRATRLPLDGRAAPSDDLVGADAPLPVLLAAGIGSRLGGHVKALWPVAGRPLLDHCVETLSAGGFDRLLIVTGHGADALEAHVPARGYPLRVEYLHNPRYAELNNFYTLRLACAAVDGPALVLNSDIIFTPEVIDAMGGATGDLSLAIEPGRVDAEALKARVAGGVVQELGKHLEPTTAFGEFIGVSLLSDAIRRRYVIVADAALARGETTLYYEDVYSRLCAGAAACAVSVPSGSWAEIDCPSDVPSAATVAARKAPERPAAVA